jgi:clan AA aspartic protease
MGPAHARVKLANPRLPDLASIEVDALADTGAAHLCIPEHVAIQLQLEELQKREIADADGSIRLVPYMGPIMISFANRRCFAGAIVFGHRVHLGTIPMEDMDLVVVPDKQEVAVNPADPNFAATIVKTFHRASRSH